MANWSESSILPQSILVTRITWLLEAFPLRLPVKQNLSIQLQIVRNNIENLRLHVWIVCANQSEVKLKEKVADHASKARQFLLEKSLTPNGTFSPACVITGRLIQQFYVTNVSGEEMSS